MSGKRIFRSLNKMLPLRYRGEEDERYWEASMLFAAADEDEANRLWEAMHVAIGCTPFDEEGECPCPHFRMSSLRQLDES